jgi:hypothetical protein
MVVQMSTFSQNKRAIVFLIHLSTGARNKRSFMEFSIVDGADGGQPHRTYQRRKARHKMVSVDTKSWLWTSLLVVLAGGFLALTIQWGSLPDSLTGMVFVLVLAGGLVITKPRQPHAVMYQPRGFATRLLKWVSAPQIEAAILLWFGVALLLQPTTVVSQSAIGWLFLLMGWLLVARLPSPMEYTLIASTRLCFTALLALDALRSGEPLVIVGAYAGSILHGVLAMLLHWTLREVAEQVAHLRKEVRGLSP